MAIPAIRRRPAFLITAVLATLALLAGCSRSGGSGDSGSQNITLHVGLFGTFGFKEAGLYDKYHQLHPNVTIKEDTVEKSDAYYKALQTHLAAGSGLDDVQGIEIGFVADIVSHHANQFVDFAKAPDAAKYNGAFYDWKNAQATTSDGKLLGLGTDSGPEAMCYRPDMLKAAGLPSDPTTLASQWQSWDSFLDFGRKYQAAAGKTKGSSFLDSAASIFTSAVYQSDLAYDDKDGKPIPDSSDGVKSAWQWASTAAKEKLTAGFDQFAPAWAKGFANNSFATIACPAWMLGYIQGQAGTAGSGKWNVTSLPGGSANWGGSFLGVPKASKHQKEAVQFVQWITAQAQQVTMFTSQQHFPSSKTAAQDPAVQNAKSTYFSNAAVGQVFGKAADQLKRNPIGPYDTQIQKAFTDQLLNVANKGTDPGKAFDDALANIKEVIGS